MWPVSSPVVASAFRSFENDEKGGSRSSQHDDIPSTSRSNGSGMAVRAAPPSDAMKHWMNERLAVADAPNGEALVRLAAEGFRTIVDLRSDGEPHPRGLPSWEEAAAARALGLRYRQIPVEPQLLGDALAHAVRDAVVTSPGSVLLHCTSGRRAGTFGLALAAIDEDLSVEDCLSRGRAMALDWDGMPRLTAFLRHFVERHGRHYRAADHVPR